jgi:hypothetical protein
VPAEPSAFQLVESPRQGHGAVAQGGSHFLRRKRFPLRAVERVQECCLRSRAQPLRRASDALEVLAQVDAEHGQVDLVSWNYKGNPLVDELLAPGAVDSRSHIDHIAFPPLAYVEHVLPDCRGRSRWNAPIHHEEARRLQKPRGPQRICLPKVRGKRVLARPSARFYSNREHFTQVSLQSRLEIALEHGFHNLILYDNTIDVIIQDDVRYRHPTLI